MRPFAPSRILISLFLGIALTAGVYSWDQYRLRGQASQEALLWARQVAVQAEGLAMDGRSQGKPDPSAWAIGFLNQAIEPRTMKITKFQRPQENAQDKQMEYHRTDGQMLDYAKVAQPENGEGFRIRINLPYRGFFGSHSKIESDLTLLVLLLAATAWFYLLIPQVFRQFREKTPPATEHQAWWLESKAVVTQLGVALRDLVKDAHGLATHTVHTREQLVLFRERSREILENVRALRRVVCSQADQVEQASRADSSEFKLNGYRLFEEQLAEIEDLLKALCSEEKSESVTREFPELTRKFNSGVTALKTSVIAQLSLMQKLKQQLDPDSTLDQGESAEKRAA